MGLYATRHMHEYGTTREQLAAIALNGRRNAQRNPKAVLQGDLTMDDYLSSKMISDPLCLFDCDIAVDGVTALIVSTREHAVRHAGQADPLRGRRQRAQRPRVVGPVGGHDTTAAASAGAHMWSRTDLTPADVDVANLYDGFTVLTLFWLEGLGFCAKGEGGPFVEGGSRIALDGELPLATSGGQLSAGRLHGFGHLYEACLQLRGEADDRQVARRDGGRGVRRRRPARLVPAAEGRGMTSHQVQLVEHPQGPVQPSHFRVAEVELPTAGRRRGARPQPVHLVRPGHAPTAARERPGGLLQLVPAQRRDGRDPDRRRGRGVARGGVRARRHGDPRLGLARLRGGQGRQALARRRRHARAHRHVARAAGEVPRLRRQHGAHRLASALRRRGGAARGRRRLGVGRRRRRRQPRGTDRQAARPHRDRQRRLAREGPRTCSTSSASTPPSTTTTAPFATSCARPRRMGSTSTSTPSAATTCRPHLAALRPWGRIAMCGAISEYESTEPQPGPDQPLPGGRQQPHAARLPRQRLPAPLPRGPARARRLPRRGSARLPRDDRRRSRERAPTRSCACSPVTPPARPSSVLELRELPAEVTLHLPRGA